MSSSSELKNLEYSSLCIINATYLRGDRGSTVVEVLCYKSEGRWFDSKWYLEFFIDIIPGVDSASNSNEYQEYFLVVKKVGT